MEHTSITNRLHEEALIWQDDYRVLRLSNQVKRQSRVKPGERPVVFFKASSGILRMSLNGAFNLITAWGLMLQGIPVIHFLCRQGMSRCVLGTDRDQPYHLPPCTRCTLHSQARTSGQKRHWFTFEDYPDLANTMKGLDLSGLQAFEFGGLPLGEIVLPSLRWVLRRHFLPDEEPIRFLMREYIVSAYRIAREFTALLDEANPQAVVVYNGMFFPEAIARRLARQRGIRAITHEVALRPFTAFFTDGEATAYPIHIPQDFSLSAEQNARLDTYLEQRFQGNFSMAGIRFWPEMRGLDEAFLQKAAQFKQIVPIFTNVIFDTSQVHANTVFPDMFAWLDMVLEIARSHPETLFIIRAHPDEMRPNKQSRDSVADWIERRKAGENPNLVFVESSEYLSSYALIQRSKFVMVYNSSIGLEASLMGAPVLCAGKARYTQYPTVFLPATPQVFRQQAETFLGVEKIITPPEFIAEARRFLYYQLYRTALPFDEFLEEHGRPGFVRLRNFDLQQLSPDHSPAMRAILDGILSGGDFTLKE